MIVLFFGKEKVGNLLQVPNLCILKPCPISNCSHKRTLPNRLLVYISLVPPDFGIQHMSSLYIHNRHTSSNQSNSTFPSILLYSFTESFECCQVQNMLLRDKLPLWIRSRNQRQLANGFITNPFINLGRHKAASWFSQTVIRKKEKKKKL